MRRWLYPGLSAFLIVMLCAPQALSQFSAYEPATLEQSTTPLLEVRLSEEIPKLHAVKGELPSNRSKNLLSMTKAIGELPPGDPAGELHFRVRVAPDRPAVFSIDPIMAALALDPLSPAAEESEGDQALIDAAELVAGIDEGWRGGFEARMNAIAVEKAVAYAEGLLEADSHLADEIAWCLSHMTPQDLAAVNIGPAMLETNAELIYRQAGKLDYVQIVELEDSHTTLLYQLEKDGVFYDWELPWEKYYRYVVNMKLDWERPGSIDPSDGAAAAEPQGMFWREYFLDPPEPPVSYANHPVFTGPVDLHGENFPEFEMQRDAAFSDFAVGPLTLVARGAEARPVMIELVPGGSAFSVIATLLPVEKMALDGDDSLLRNMLSYLNDGRRMIGSYEVLLLKERDPYGQPVVENTLDDLEIPYQLISIADLATIGDTINWRMVKKIVVPSDQPLSFWQALEEQRETLEGLIRRGLCLELHAAVDQGQDVWDGAVMPGGFTRSTREGRAEGTFTEGGYPKLTDLMSGTAILWDGVRYDGISGGRLFDPGTFGLDKLGFFVGDVLTYNVSERGTHYGGSPERAVQAVRVANNHYGNCGELQDLSGAVSRTMLVPNLHVHNSTEDHVWNMVYLDDAWLPFQVDWSDGPTRINNHGISYDKQQGGGKDCSCIVASEGDGTVRSFIEHFSDSVTLKVRVTDAAGRPVDGAKILVASEAWGSDTNLSIGLWGVTDGSGEYQVKLGDHANYYLRVSSPLGSKPSIPNQVSQVISAEDAVKDEVFSVDLQLEESYTDQWEVSDFRRIMDFENRLFLAPEAASEWSAILGENAYSGDTTYHETETVAPRWLVMDKEQLEDYLDKDGREASAEVDSDAVGVELPSDHRWYLVLLPDAVNREVVFTGTLRSWKIYPQSPDGDEDVAPDGGDADGDGHEFADGDEETDIDREEDDSAEGSGGAGCRQTGSGLQWICMIGLGLALWLRGGRRKKVTHC